MYSHKSPTEKNKGLTPRSITVSPSLTPQLSSSDSVSFSKTYQEFEKLYQKFMALFGTMNKSPDFTWDTRLKALGALEKKLKIYITVKDISRDEKHLIDIYIGNVQFLYNSHVKYHKKYCKLHSSDKTLT